MRSAEIQYETRLQPCGFEVVQALGDVSIAYGLGNLQFEDHLLLHQEVALISPDDNIIIIDFYLQLLLNPQAYLP